MRPTATTFTKTALHQHRRYFLELRAKHGYLPAGLIDVFKPRGAAGLVEIYNAAIQGMDPDSGPYAVVCEPHASVINVETLSDAQAIMRSPEEFCEYCQARKR